MVRKKLLILILCLIPVLCFGDIDTWDGMSITTGTYIDGATPGSLDSIAVKAAGGGGYLFYWACEDDSNADYPSDKDVTLNGGAAIAGSGYENNMLQTSNDYHGYAGVTISSEDIIDIDGVGRIRFWFRSTEHASDRYLFRASGQTYNFYAVRQTSTALVFNYGTDSVSFFSGGGEFLPADNTWYHFEFYWNTTSNIHGIRCLNRNCSDDGEGTCESEESISSAPTNDSTLIELGGANTGTSYIDLDEIYIYSTEEE